MQFDESGARSTDVANVVQYVPWSVHESKLNYYYVPPHC